VNDTAKQKETAKVQPAKDSHPLSPASVAEPPASPSAQPAASAPPGLSRAEEEQAKRQAEEQAKRAQEEQAKRQADEQAKRAADEQAKRQAEEQAKRAADEQAKRQADEQAKNNARAAELQSVTRALKDYQAAYEHKDAAALQAIWPSISKQSLDGIRGSFRDASEVAMELRPVGDPEIAGSTATVTCERTIRQVIQKKPFEASTRVRIVLSRKGTGWLIQSVEALGR
jgi:hypothetical protein